MLVLGLDVETTGIDIKTLRVIELGAVLYDIDFNTPVDILTALIREKDMPEKLDPKIEKLTGITTEMLEKYGKNPAVVFERFFEMYQKADCVIAHNGNKFDKPVMQNFISISTRTCCC